ncbi:MAG: zinc-binding dehydrogenase [Elusimicrobiota bacterium]
MRRIVVREPGGHGALELIEEPEPAPGPGQVRVRVRAAGVNYADCLVRMGLYGAAKGRYPLTPGFEFAGVVDAAGDGAAAFRKGDRVFGITRFGGYADSIVAGEDRLWPCPEGWDFPECAAFPAVFLTAHYGLFRVAKIEAGETVLVHSAAGGAGTALLQLAAVAGCRAVAVVGAAHKAALCREMGATVVVRSGSGWWAEVDRAAPGGFDAVFDANGVSTLRPGYERLAAGGRLVVYGFAEIMPRGRDRPGRAALAWNRLRVPRFSPFEMTSANRAVMGFNVVYLFHKLDLARRAMEELLGWVRQGSIRKVPVTGFPLERAAEAHRAIESGRTTGKLVLTA